MHHLGCVFDGKGEDGEDWGGRCVKRRKKKQRGRSDGDRCLCIRVTTSRKSAWSRGGVRAGMEGHCLKRVRACVHRLFVCQCVLQEDETMSFRELGGASGGRLLAAATTIPAARRVTHSKVSFRSPISSTEWCPAGSRQKAVVEPAVVWPEDTASRRVDSSDLPHHESACSSR